MRMLEKCTSLQAELWAIITASSVIKEKRLSRVVMKTDYHMAVELTHGSCSSFMYVVSLVG